MTRFILRVLLFLAVVRVFDLGLAAILASNMESKTRLTQDPGSIHRMYAGEINADIVCFGSSRTLLHVNPNILQQETGLSAWNLGLGGSNFEQQKFTLEEYLLHNRTPRVVLFEADLASLDPSLLRFDTALFLPHRNDSEHTRRLFSRDWQESAYYWLFSSAIYKHEIPTSGADVERIAARIMRGDTTEETALGIRTMTEEDPGEIWINGAQLKIGQVSSELPASLPYALPVTGVDLSKAAIRKAQFTELAALAEKSGFTLVLFFPPYMAGDPDEAQRQAVIDFYSGLTRRFPGMHLLDHGQDPLVSSQLELWWDSSHLNLEGANILSEELGREILELLRK